MKFKLWLTACSSCIPLACICQEDLLVKKADRYELHCMKEQHMEIAPGTGGRITGLWIDGKNFLTDSLVNSDNWGSTFWPSPQKNWNWPPPAILDNHPYSAIPEGKTIKMESGIDPRSGLSVMKLFSSDKAKGSYQLEYIITNHSDTSQKTAPWEVTRVHPNGFSFFPMGKGGLRGGLVPQTKIENGICWFIYNQQMIPAKGDTQLYSDGSEGWFAQVNDGIILIKVFPDIPLESIAPEEGEVELYANKGDKGKTYVEIEQQGAYTELKAGQSVSWHMRWLLRKLPPHIRAIPGNPALVEYVRNLIR